MYADCHASNPKRRVLWPALNEAALSVASDFVLRCEREFDSLLPIVNFKKFPGQPAVLM
jgi:hypothetical protein